MNRFLPAIIVSVLFGQLAPAPAQVKVKEMFFERPEAHANTQKFPSPMLKSSVNLNVATLSPNTSQLCDAIGLTSRFQRIGVLRSRLASYNDVTTLESLATKQELYEAVQQVSVALQRTNLDIDFTLAEINAEENIYKEQLAACEAEQKKITAYSNSLGAISNSALYSASSALAIPAWKNPTYAAASGTVGVFASLVPSFISICTSKALTNTKHYSEDEPNMLTKLFGYPISEDVDYPQSVWSFLTSVPVGENTTKNRRDQLIDRWIADSNIVGFTNRHSKKQLEIITASTSRGNTLTIDILRTRLLMLDQLAVEVLKMKRLLLELVMTIEGDKRLD